MSTLHHRPDLIELPRVWSYVPQDAELVDVRIVLRVESFELWMEGFVAGAGQTSIAFIDLGVWVTLLEVDQVVFTGYPGWHLVGDLVDLGTEAFVLDEAAEWLRVSDQTVLGLRRYEHAGTQVAFIVLTG